MESEDISEIINMQSSADFLSAEELVSLRKPEEQSIQLNIGLKFNECLKTPHEKEAVDCALDNQKAILTQKRGARICDLMKANWNEELNALVVTQLKGKFVQHMGQRIGDKIVLSVEEALFLLENGCLEITNGEMPLSTEEAYALMLKENLSVEKYEVYSYLSQLGFIVVPHQKKLVKDKLQSKVANVQKNKRKRKNPSPLPENHVNKRLNFSGVFSEETDISKSSTVTDEKEKVEPVNEPSSLIESCIDSERKEHEEDEASALVKSSTDIEHKKHEENEASILVKPSTDFEGKSHGETEGSTFVSSSTENNHKFHDKNENDIAVTEHSSENKVISVSPIKELENSGNNSDVEIELDNDKSSLPNPSVSAPVVEMDIDSQGTDVSVGVLEKSRDGFVTETGINIHCKTATQSLHLVGDDENTVDERNSDLLSLSCSSLDELENSDEDISQDNMYIDDDITVVEVTKKETTPLAVIDLLSDEESGNEISGNIDSESDDEIKILEVCNGSSYKDKGPATMPFNPDKLKSKKISNYKREEGDNQSFQNSAPVYPFPELFRKDLMCVARPSANLLPFQVRPAKEVYILERSQQTNRNEQNSTSAQPQGRLWNSYKDMQSHQRSLRQNKQFNRHRGQDRLWHRGPKHQDGDRPWHRGSRDHDKDRSWHRGPRHHDEDRSWHRNRRYHDDSKYHRPSYHSQHLSRGLQNDITRPDRNFSHVRLNDMTQPESIAPSNQLNGAVDQKPLLSTTSPAKYGNNSDQGACSSQDTGLLPNPHMFDSTAEIYPPHQPPALNFPFGNGPISMPSRNPSLIPNLTSQQFVAEVHRTAYSYATSMLSNMLGSAFNTNHFSPLNHQGVRLATHFSMAQPITLNNSGYNFGNINNPFASNDYFLGNRQTNSDFPRNRRQHTGNPFPNIFRNVNVRDKKSWNEVKSAVEGNTMQDDGSSDIEEIPINLNEFLWNVSNICPLVKPGTKYPVSEALNPLKLTQLARLTDKSCRYDKYVSTTNTLEISFDVYSPSKHFKKSCPGIPKLRVIVTRATHPIPVYSEISWLKREFSDGADLQIAVVDNGDISFVSFNSINLPDSVPFDN